MANPGLAKGALSSLSYAFFSLAAIVVTMIFFFPIFWSLSNSLRDPLQTFTVVGLGIPWINFEPTFDNWIDQDVYKRQPR